MESLKELYKIGNGPSSSHTMGPARASQIFKEKNPEATSYLVTLYGSLAATGKGHLTDKIILDILGKDKTIIEFKPELVYKYHPNGMKLRAYKDGVKVDSWLVFSVGGGSLKNLDEPRECFTSEIYLEKDLSSIIEYCKLNNLSLVDYVYGHEDIKEYLNEVLDVMFKAINRGLYTDGELPGGLHVQRKAGMFYSKYLENHDLETLCYAASRATAEENASGGVIVTSPTCGASAVVPAVLYAESLVNNIDKDRLVDALCVGGVIGNVVKTNGSISGAEVGCQGEVGVACSMAAGMIAYLNGGSIDEIEYAAEIALEHHLGMTCDPVNGLVQIPCIERNCMAAMQAYNCAKYAMMAGGVHKISFDHVVEVMEKTGKDLNENYRETSRGGLAAKE